MRTEQVIRRAYEADIWLVEGGHVISFTAGKNTLTEVIVTNNEPLTDRGLLQTIPCRGEKYHEMTAGGNIRYMISTQEEQLTQTLYDATKHEIATYAAKRELMTAETPATPKTGGVPQRAGHRTPQPRAARAELPPVRREPDGHQDPGDHRGGEGLSSLPRLTE